MKSVTDRPRELLIRSQQNEDGHVLVAVVDSGIGIEPEERGQAFQGLLHHKASGMGMGLSICRSIIEAYGGQVLAANNPGPGATFQFTLPSSGERAS